MNGLDVTTAQQIVERSVIREPVHPEFGAFQAARPAAVLHADEALTARNLQLGGRVGGLDAAIDDERDPVTQLVGGRHVVRRQEYRAAARLQVEDDVLDLARVHRIETRGRLVQEQAPGC